MTPVVALGELAGKARQTSPDRLNRDTFTYVDISAIDRTAKRIIDAQSMSVKEAPSRARQLIHTGDVLVSTVRPNLNAVAQVTDRYDGEIASTGFCVIRPVVSRLDSSYLFYFVQTDRFISHLVSRSTGAGYPAVTDEDVMDAPIPLPPLAEQQRIAGLLRRADRLRRLRRYALEVSAGYLQAVFVEMFGDPVRNPMGWEQQRLGEVIAGFQAGVNIPPISENEQASEWRVLKVSAVTWGDFDPMASKPIPPDTEFDESHVVRKGDLLISRANTTELVGAVSLVRIQPSRVLLPDKLWRICFKEKSQLLPEFTLHALRQEGMRKAIGELATGSSGSMKNISQEKAAILPVTLPPLDLQVRFGEIAEKSERIRLQQKEALRQSEHLFQALLQRAFSSRERR